MKAVTAVLAAVPLVVAHGQHHFDLDDKDQGMTYAERHMHTEHHIDSFDLPSFFKLHDLNMDGFWDTAEIQAVYGLKHDASHNHGHAKMDPVDIEEKRTRVLAGVLDRLDSNKDGRISLEEYIAGGTGGLPNFDGYEDLGHHYDEESEYFLHHEELYHSTPETQTDESYNHPEDIEHFKNHHHIEEEEDARERKFQGLPSEADLSKDHVAASDPLDEHAHAPGEGGGAGAGGGSGGGAARQQLKAGEEAPPPPPLTRAAPGAQPNRILPPGSEEGDARRQELLDAKRRAGEGVHDPHRVPRSPEERLKAGVPYKYKMRKGFRKEEF